MDGWIDSRSLDGWMRLVLTRSPGAAHARLLLCLAIDSVSGRMRAGGSRSVRCRLPCTDHQDHPQVYKAAKALFSRPHQYKTMFQGDVEGEGGNSHIACLFQPVFPSNRLSTLNTKKITQR